MANCYICGAAMPDYAASCPICGTPVQQAAPNPGYGNPYQQPYQQPYAAQPPRDITSSWAWFGWILLCMVLPVIGPIIMLASSNDPSAKNYGKCMLILQTISIGACVMLWILFAGAMMRYF